MPVILLVFVSYKIRFPYFTIIWFVIPVVSYKLCWFYQLSNATVWW